jgi:hypothetical protein
MSKDQDVSLRTKRSKRFVPNKRHDAKVLFHVSMMHKVKVSEFSVGRKPIKPVVFDVKTIMNNIIENTKQCERDGGYDNIQERNVKI